MGEARTAPLNRVEVVFPGTTGYISVKNTGTSGIKLAFHQSGAELRLQPGEIAPVQGADLYDVRIGPYCTGSPDTLSCGVPSCQKPCCAWCGRHLEDHEHTDSN